MISELFLTGVFAVALSCFTFAGAGGREMKSYVHSHKLYFRAITVLMIVIWLFLFVMAVIL